MPVRSLRRSPAFSVTAALMLAIGIGTSVAIFALVNGVLLRPLPFGDPGRLVSAWFDLPALDLRHMGQTPSTYFLYQRLAHTIEGIGIYVEGEVNVADSAGTGEPQRTGSASMSASLIPVLEVPPILGRAFTAEDDRPKAPLVTLIGEAMWRTRFAADPNVIGRALLVNGLRRAIVGVMPATFRFPAAATQLWFPVGLDPAEPFPGGFGYNGIVRLKPGVTVADAQRIFGAASAPAGAVSGLRPRRHHADDDRSGAPQAVVDPPARRHHRRNRRYAVGRGRCRGGRAARVVRQRRQPHDRARRVAPARVAVRKALGAGRARVMLHFFPESGVLAGVASLVGLAAAAVALRALVAAGPAGIPRLSEVKIDGTTLVFTLAVAVLVTVACSLVPALRIGRGALALHEGGRSGTAGRVQHRLRGGLVAAQIALALVVLAGSGLLLRTFQRLQRCARASTPRTSRHSGSRFPRHATSETRPSSSSIHD